MKQKEGVQFYHTTAPKLAGTDLAELHRKAFAIYKTIKAQSKRRPYIRSKYFDGQKIFLSIFWQHLNDKNRYERARRLRYYSCAIDLLRNSRCAPTTKVNPETASELLHRFYGTAKDGSVFFVQVKEDHATRQRFLLSVFPEN